MPFLAYRHVWILALVLPLVGIPACSNKDNPDEIRRQTAEATETVRRDTKAVVEGVKEGMRSDKTSDKAIDINSASRDDLLGLPGMTQHEADRIIAERPFKNANELVARHIIPESEYDKIRDRIVAGR
jgi:DNA uptake protein ComE-like DNA-binding protein